MPRRFEEPAKGRRRRAPVRNTWTFWAVFALVVVTAMILLFNQQHSGDPLKVRRELRKF